jgi:GTP-binding protein YchF
MGLQCGIVGLPNVGKSTIFNALSSAKAEAANYPFCTIDPNIGVITVPDVRLHNIADLVKPARLTPTVIEIVDIAGLVRGASKGEGLGNKFLSNIRSVHAVIHVVRCFTDDNVAHVDGEVNPRRDKEIIDLELQLKDLETIEKRIARTEKMARSGDREARREMDFLNKLKAHLELGENLRTITLSGGEENMAAELNLLSIKPVIYVANIDEDDLHGDGVYVKELRNIANAEGAALIPICGALEAQIAELETEEEKSLFLQEYQLSESGLNKLIRASYEILDLITFFTAGPKEVRAWTVRKGWKAPQAAGVIHTDFEKGFIRAEVIKYKDFLELKSEHACKEAGKMALEGKEYVVEDGDIIYFRFNV